MTAISVRYGYSSARCGLAYVIITVLSLFAISVLDGPTEPDNPVATVDNIVNFEALFRAGIAAFTIVLIADVVVAWALYAFFQRTSRELSLFAACRTVSARRARTREWGRRAR
jgi:hypothetical protein